MDVAGGFGICRGPRNVLAPIYEGAPIGITVEGANILTRSLIVFGQGAIRCHPYALAEIRAVEARDVAAFDRALAGHVGFALRNAARSFVLALSGGALAPSPVGGRAGEAIRQLARASASFAVVGEAAMATLGGGLKRAENLTGRMADALAWMYIASATINRYAAAPSDEPLFEWATTEALYQVHAALRGVIDNLPNRVAAAAVRWLVFPFGVRAAPPTDRMTAAAARSVLDDPAARLRLTSAMFVPEAHEIGLGRLEHALELTRAARAATDKLRGAGGIDAAVAAGVVTPEERSLVIEAAAARDDAIQVDAYSPAAFQYIAEPPRRSPARPEPPASARH
jgi:acyl-CoA dehydrogenase